jgi:hypothetical protein
MNQDILCTWLGLPKCTWPPDAWTLLGLTRDEHDLSTIEERVQDRMTKLRHYQLSFPEEATEGMNRLAEAFVTLTEACGKKPVTATNGAAAKMPSNGAALPKDETSIIDGTKLDWRNEPPPVRKETDTAPELIVYDGTAPDDAPVSQPFAAPAKPQRRAIDPSLARELAEESEEATRNVGTIEAVIERVETTRRLLYAWERVGRYLKVTTKKITPTESERFAKRLQTVDDIMKTYPAFLGHPGKPGYRVVVQARLKIPLLIVRAMTPDQREELLFDWQDGYQVLLAHRKYLHKLFKSMRHRSTVGLFLHAVRSFLNDYPRLTLIGMVLLVVLGLIGGALLAWPR